MLPGRHYADIVCMAFRPPLVGAPGVGFHGGPVLTADADRYLRHTRYGEPVDWFD